MKIKNIVSTVLIAVFFLALSLWSIFGKTPDYSESERRVLASFPEVIGEHIMSGQFASEFEEYVVDRFPARDVWRSIKAYVRIGLFLQKDNNDIFAVDNHISKLEYPMNREMADHAIEIFTKVKEKYLQENKVYFAVIPDKNRYLAEKNGYLSVDYDAFSQYMKDRMDYAEYIEIADLLDQDDYYYTDTHWRQDAIVDVAERIATAMGTDISQEYRVNKLSTLFSGVYVGQSALVCEPDTITYLTSEITDRVLVEGAKAVYDMKKASGRDSYEMFLSGNQAIVTIKDPENHSGKRLIMFRDSFGSSIAPLFTKGYSEIVLIDLRYVSSDMLAQFVDFKNADVLFLYSTLLLNNSLSIK